MKKIVSLFLTVLFSFSIFLSIPVFAVENLQEPTVIWGSLMNTTDQSITVSTSAPFSFEKITGTIMDTTLMIDAVTGNGIDITDFLPNQLVYVYFATAYPGVAPRACAVIANIPQDFRVPQLVTVKSVKKTEDYIGEIVALEDNKTYKITSTTFINRFCPKGMGSIASIPKIDDIKEGTKLFIYSNNDNTLNKCLITPIRVTAPQIIEGKIVNLAGSPITQAPYLINNELYLPLRVIAESMGYKVDWINSPQTAIVRKGDREISLPIGNEHYIINSSTYVSENFLKYVLQIEVIENSDEILINDGAFTVLSHFDFETGDDGFIPLFSDYHDDGNNFQSYQMTSGHKNIPIEGITTKGLYIASQNRSDDMLMGYIKTLNGLDANTQYTFKIRFNIATSCPSGMVGIGGSPGEDVIVKCGITTIEPKSELKDGIYRVNIDTGSQTNGGKDLKVVGNMVKTDGSDNFNFALKSFETIVTTTTDSKGECYLVIATDSGFEGFTEYYLDNISINYSNN